MLFFGFCLFLFQASVGLASAGAGSATTSATAATSQSFCIVALPDTQHYELSLAYLFGVQTHWIAENREARNIRFVVHEGDITDRNQPEQWENAQAAMRILDGVVPYSVAPGNHDIGANGWTGTRDTTLYNQYFPVDYYSTTTTFGGVYDPEPTRYDNNYHTFSAGGTDWLVLSLEFGPRDGVLNWANSVVASHPQYRVIVVTHDYLFSNETRHDESESWDPHTYGVANDPEGVNDGEEMWNKFVRKHPNITFVLNGHVLNDGQGRLVSVGDHGNRVYQMLANYQTLANGGNGYLRILEFDPVHRTVSGTSYSPSLDANLTDWQNQFMFENVDLSPPTGPPSGLLYHENFDEGTFTGYTIVDEGTIEGPSIWQLVDGEIVQSSNIYGPAVDSVSNRQGTFAVYDTAPAYEWSHYRFEATIRSTDDDGIGLLFYYQNADNYYKLDLDRQRNFRKLFRKLNGEETTVAEMAGQYKANDDMDVVIELRDGLIRVRLDEADLFGGPVQDNGLTQGTFGFYCWGNQNSVFDDILVEPLVPPQPGVTWVAH